MSFAWHKRAAVAPEVLFQEVAGEAVLLNMKTEQYHGLDPVGTRMWTLMASGITFEETKQALLKEFDVEEDRLAADLKEFTEMLEGKGLIEIQA